MNNQMAAPKDRDPLLEVRNLRVALESGKTVVDGLDLTIGRREVVALVGESGSGKSVTALALSRLLPDALQLVGGSICFEGQDIVKKSEAELNRMRGADISMLFQQPQVMLDPTARVHTQVAEPLRQHRGLNRRAAFDRVVELLHSVGIPAPAQRARAFSYQLSGGMAQRVMIAAAMAAGPKLLIADEPTTALDVTVQTQILRLLKAERERQDLSILLITHDLSIVSAFADRVAVMYAGRILEEGPTEQIMNRPTHPYTRALIRCSLLVPEDDGRLLSIPGSGSNALEIKCGCRFAPRCALMQTHPELHAACHGHEPALEAVGDGWKSRCHAADNLQHEGDAA
ncbi:ABC transporter ATP-binding protein [Natronohydrobacter thiooxidans]|uniref:ABC transporter ATP-binding protein n=1 Tax=Natronohydrobacter thiooxidans TaxID=87172 RepID=UPI0008FF1DA0|nr:ABC transporter ATP-binding protein [Natronohydrobacter thiooxidans]